MRRSSSQFTEGRPIVRAHRSAHMHVVKANCAMLKNAVDVY